MRNLRFLNYFDTLVNNFTSGNTTTYGKNIQNFEILKPVQYKIVCTEVYTYFLKQTRHI